MAEPLPTPIASREVIRVIVREVMAKHPGEAYSTAEIEQLQKELFDEVKVAIEREGYTFDPAHFSRWQLELWRELEDYVHRPTLFDHLLEDG